MRRGHNPRSAREYISRLNVVGEPDCYEVYQDLCNLTHPSAYSVSWMIGNQKDTGSSYSFSFNPLRQMETGKILLLSTKYQVLFHNLLLSAMNSALLALKMGNLLTGRSPEIDRIDLSQVPAWPNLEETAKNSTKSKTATFVTLKRQGKQVLLDCWARNALTNRWSLCAAPH